MKSRLLGFCGYVLADITLTQKVRGVRGGERPKMTKISFMSRLTLGILVALILFGVTFTFTTGLTTAVNGIAAYYAPEASAPFPQPFWELLLSFAVAFIPIAIVVWDHQAATKAEVETRAPGQPGT